MRTKRKAEEEFFAQKFMDYFRTKIDEGVIGIPEVTDKPDLAISSQGIIIGVEFSQFQAAISLRISTRKGRGLRTQKIKLRDT